MVKKKKLKASFTVEAAILVSMILFLLYGIILVLFYYHDKNILTGAAFETVTVAARKQIREPPFGEEETEKLLKERISGKMLIFRRAEVEVECQKNYVWISVQASRKGMHITTQARAGITEPEKKIRDIRKIKKATGQNRSK
nr:pilus assembly protein [uncultured Sellimonas sp.]